jgi:hypothetical protein
MILYKAEGKDGIGTMYKVAVKFPATDGIVFCKMIFSSHPITQLMVGYIYTLNTISNLKYKV